VLGGAASVTSPRAAFSVVGGGALVLALWALTTKAPSPRQGQSLVVLWRSLREPRIAAGIWLVALPALMFGTLSVLAPLRLSALGFGAVAIGAVYLLSAGFEAAAAPLVGRVSDRRGRRLPIVIGLIASAAVTAVLPWPPWGALLAVVVITAGTCFGMFWVPAMSLLTDTAEGLGLDHAMAFALVSLAWAPGQALGAAVGGAVARASSDAVPYLVLGGFCLLTLAAVRRR
jgi:predicted MFS family arabinose efflux permease